MARALIIVDVQNDFCEGGSLGVEGGAAVAGAITEYLDDHSHEFDVVVATQDWHVDPGSHFSENPDFKDSWPVHCKAGTAGAELHRDLDTEYLDATFRKGRFAAAYSGFEGLLASTDTVMAGEREATESSVVDDDGETLDEWLRENEVDDLVVVGLATDHCVLATAVDGVQAGYNVSVIRVLTAAVSDTEGAFEQMEDAGVVLI